MTENEAIKWLKAWSATHQNENDNIRESVWSAIQALEENQQYHAIGTVEECQEAMEKQRAKKVITITRNYIGCYKCPRCNNSIGKSVYIQRPKYCEDCGQKLD